AFVTDIWSEVIRQLAVKRDSPTAVLTDATPGRRFLLPPDTMADLTITGPGHVLLAWLLGRDMGDSLSADPEGPLPAVPPYCLPQHVISTADQPAPMPYTANVTVGGPQPTRQGAGLTMTQVAVGPMDNNAYLLRCASTGDLLLIDAANEPETLLNLIGGQPLATIVTTHLHGDHWQALEAVAKATGAETVAHLEDAPGL